MYILSEKDIHAVSCLQKPKPFFSWTRLVRNATEERLHRRIAELEVTMLAMLSKTALQAGVGQSQLIDPPLRETLPSRLRVRACSPGAQVFPHRANAHTPLPSSVR